MDYQSRLRRLVATEWYSPSGLLSSPTDFHFPGDRFIPNKSLMNLDQAHGLLTDTTKEYHNPKFNDAYRQKVAENSTLDSKGRLFRMLVFNRSPKSCRKSNNLVDEMRKKDANSLRNRTKQCQIRYLPKKEARILDAPNLRNDYYSNIMDWGRNNILAIALGPALYLWKWENGQVQKLLEVPEENDHSRSVSWSQDGRNLAVGYMDSKLPLWDAETSKLDRNLEGHEGRVATASWNHWNTRILTSGSQDKSIINHDVEWNRHHKEILSDHGFSTSKDGNKLCSWKYLQMTKLGGLQHQTSRIELSQSPNGLTVVSAGADET